MITDLNAESEPLPMDTIKEDWLGHKVGRDAPTASVPKASILVFLFLSSLL